MGQVGQNLVGERVKEARSKAQPAITQEELSKRLSKIETGIRGVLDFELVALAKSLDVKVTWLLGVKE